MRGYSERRRGQHEVTTRKVEEAAGALIDPKGHRPRPLSTHHSSCLNRSLFLTAFVFRGLAYIIALNVLTFVIFWKLFIVFSFINTLFLYLYLSYHLDQLDRLYGFDFVTYLTSSTFTSLQAKMSPTAAFK